MKKPADKTAISFTDYIHQCRPGTQRIQDIPVDELNELRGAFIEKILSDELGQLSEVEKSVARSVSRHRLMAGRHPDSEEKSTPGERIADKVASFGGSWKFIILFMSILFLWMMVNAWWLRNKAFDPYPFILLNLVLSCVAALQAPVIMMSQNRQEAKDRQRAENDYKVNLKAEVEIRMLHEKLDHILLHQNKSLLEIQKVQMEMMQHISDLLSKK